MAKLLGKCLWIRVEVRPGHVVKKPAVMAEVQVDTTGLKADQWRYCIMSDLVERVWTLFEQEECCGRCVFGAGLRCWRSM